MMDDTPMPSPLSYYYLILLVAVSLVGNKKPVCQATNTDMAASWTARPTFLEGQIYSAATTRRALMRGNV